jgi:hypothetical protein
MQTPEGRLKDKIKAFLKERDAYYFMPVQMGYGAPSVDFLVCYHGKFVALETKAPGGKPTKRQVITLETMREAGAETWWGDDFEQFTIWWNTHVEMLKDVV